MSLPKDTVYLMVNDSKQLVAKTNSYSSKFGWRCLGRFVSGKSKNNLEKCDADLQELIREGYVLTELEVHQTTTSYELEMKIRCQELLAFLAANGKDNEIITIPDLGIVTLKLN